jgi:hypothetical protein
MGGAVGGRPLFVRRWTFQGFLGEVRGCWWFVDDLGFEEKVCEGLVRGRRKMDVK